MDVEARHLVEAVEHDAVLPGEDGEGDRAVGQHEVGLEPGCAERGVGAGRAEEGLQQHRDVHKVAEVQHEEMVLTRPFGNVTECNLATIL